MLIVKTCPYLVTPDSGTKDTNATVCGSIVAFNCNECYELKGEATLSCLPNETWSGEAPVCARKCYCNLYSLIFMQLRCIIVKSCRSLVAPANGHKSSFDNSCGATVTFDCDQCYELEGPRELSCLENETWSGDEPTCTGQFIFLFNGLHY